MENVSSSVAARLRQFALASSSIAAGLIPAAEPTAAQKRRAEEIAYQLRYNYAAGLLMTSTRATAPRPSTVRRMLRLLERNGPSTKGALIEIGRGKYAHPTKGARG